MCVCVRLDTVFAVCDSGNDELLPKTQTFKLLLFQISLTFFLLRNSTEDVMQNVQAAQFRIMTVNEGGCC